MDAFYAAVEQRDNPELRGKPVIVGGSPQSRAVVCTASYEARKFGVHSAMACSKAYRLCPQGIFIPPNFPKYKEASRQIHEVFHEYTDLVEPLSLDEAFLDVTINKKAMPSATIIAKEILKKIQERTGLTASAGVAPGKFLAKVASGMNKPNGLTLVDPKTVETFVENLPIGKFFGVGPATEKRMLAVGIKTGKDLKQWSLEQLQKHFGKMADYYYQISRGIDNRSVNPYRERKSLSAETTFAKDTHELPTLIESIREVADEVARRLQRSNLKGKTITLKVRYSNFERITRSHSVPEPVNDAQTLATICEKLIESTDYAKQGVRLIGVGVAGFGEEQKAKNKRIEKETHAQLKLF